MGFEIEASHHEGARGQHEIDFKYDEALDCADKIMTFKLAVKSLAQKNGLHATFMPKPLFGLAGSGMHINMSLFRDGKNIFFDEKGEKQLSSLAYSFIAGLLEHVKGFTALTNPLVNSYKRLVPGYEAPCYLAWSASNRSALIRIPAARGQSTRVELRSPDPACNPYLAVAACLAAGLDGIQRGLTPPPEITGNIYEMDDSTRAASGIQALPLLPGGGPAGDGGRPRHHGRAGRPCGLSLHPRQDEGVERVLHPGVQLGTGEVSGHLLSPVPPLKGVKPPIGYGHRRL